LLERREIFQRSRIGPPSFKRAPFRSPRFRVVVMRDPLVGDSLSNPGVEICLPLWALSIFPLERSPNGQAYFHHDVVPPLIPDVFFLPSLATTIRRTLRGLFPRDRIFTSPGKLPFSRRRTISVATRAFFASSFNPIHRVAEPLFYDYLFRVDFFADTFPPADRKPCFETAAAMGSFPRQLSFLWR